MPDSALLQTERQFSACIAGGADERPVRIRRYSLPHVARGRDVSEHLRQHYFSIDSLWAAPPDAVIVTGAEPVAAQLPDEPFWGELVALLDWARGCAVSTIASCLAAHVSLLAFDDVERGRLVEKRSGVYEQVVAPGRALGVGMAERVHIPHSRLNDVAVGQVDGAGYDLLVSSEEIGWTVATKEIDSHLLVLMQGHPEYETNTLFLEYRRDVRRYVNRERDVYPPLPVGYFSVDVERAFEDFRERAVTGVADPELMLSFPQDEALNDGGPRWRAPSELFYSNWLDEVARRSNAKGVAHAR